MTKKHLQLKNRDISWLSFNDRVLQEAEDPGVPLLEPLRFLGIFSSNRDEFFRVRVATIRRMAKYGKKAKKIFGIDPDVLLEDIQQLIIRQQVKFDMLYADILKQLGEQKIFIVNEKNLSS